MSGSVGALLATAPPTATAVLLGRAGWSKRRDGRALASALRRHDLLPPSARGVLVATLPLLELGLGALMGVGVLLAVLRVDAAVLAVAGAGVVVLGAAFVAYQAAAIRRAAARSADWRALPCGCGAGAGSTLGAASVARAAGVLVSGAAAVAGALGRWASAAPGVAAFGVVAVLVAVVAYSSTARLIGGAGAAAGRRPQPR